MLVERGRRADIDAELTAKYLTFDLDDWIFTADTAMGRLLKHFQTGSLKGFGIHDLGAAIIAAGAILHYLDITQHTSIGHITSVKRIEEDSYVRLDKFTVRNLELIEPMTAEGKKPSVGARPHGQPHGGTAHAAVDSLSTERPQGNKPASGRR